MTDFTTSDRDVNRAIRSWLHEDRHEDASRIAGAVLDHVEATTRRRATWWPARRTPIMNKILTIGLGAAAVVAVLLLGSQLLGSPDTGLGGPGEPTATSEPIATPEPSVDAGLPVGSPLVWLDSSAGGAPITITIPAPGWNGDLPGFYFVKGEDGNPPDGAVMMAFSDSQGWTVPGDACAWESTMPGTPSATVDELVATLSAQAPRDASAPVDISVGGYAGKSITLHVPDPMPDCDDDIFCTMAIRGMSGPDSCERISQGPGQIDELWIVDVDGTPVLIFAAYYEGTPAAHVAEMRAIVDSVTFEAP